jgi:dTDP-glucose 4,6-dehydratase
MDEKLGRESGTWAIDILCKDRPGHLRYAIDANKINRTRVETLGYFWARIGKNSNWYLENQAWLNNITSGEYELRETI